jgi:hypothetical protein
MLEYKQYTDEALSIMLDIKNSYDAAKKCYQAKIEENKNNHNPRSNPTQQAQDAIAQIDSIISTRITVKLNSILARAKEADARLKTIQDMETKIAAAKTVNDLRSPTENLSNIIQAGGISNAADIQRAKEDLEAIKEGSADLKQDAIRYLQSCQALN